MTTYLFVFYFFCDTRSDYITQRSLALADICLSLLSTELKILYTWLLHRMVTTTIPPKATYFGSVLDLFITIHKFKKQSVLNSN